MSAWGESASPLHHCGATEPHGPHEWFVRVQRVQCEGVVFDREDGEPETLTEPTDPEHREAVRRIAEEHGITLSDWRPTLP